MFAHIFFKSRTLKPQYLPFFALFLMFFIALAVITVSQSVHAAGGVGGGGSGGGGSGGAQTGYGYGWYVYNTDGSGTGSPAGLRNGGTWASVQQTCRDANANKIVAFIVQTPSRTPQTAIVYNYTSDYGRYNLYLGGSGGNWEEYTTASSQYYSLPSYGVSIAGYNFGGPNGNVAWFCYDFQPKNWQFSPSIKINNQSVSNINVTPGTKVTWTYTIKNTGEATTSSVKYGNKITGGTANSTYKDSGAVAVGDTRSFTNSLTASQDDVGKGELCRYTLVRPRSNTDSSQASSGKACYTVPYNYTLTPVISTSTNGDSTTTISPETKINITGSVKNGGPTKSKGTTWAVTSFQLTGATIPHNDTAQSARTSSSSISPCQYFAVSGVSNCKSPINNDRTYSGTNKVFNAGTTAQLTSSPAVFSVPDLAVGTRVCFVVSVTQWTDSTSNTAYTKPRCYIIAKSPLIQVLGGDLRVGSAFSGTGATSNVQTSLTIKNNNSYGSWDEYGIIATGIVDNTGSGSAFAQPRLCDGACIKQLTLSNSPNSGNYSTLKNVTIPDVAATFPATGAPNFSSLAADVKLNRVETITPSGTAKTIGNVKIEPGQWLVINAPNSVITINGNITYNDTAPITSIGQIPQLVIIAKQINITDNVDRVDAWLIAKNGSINTCSTVPLTTALTSNLCNKQLTINGPVMASQLYLRRTFGADTGADSGNPGEIINLRPDAYLWGSYQASLGSRLDTTATTELPPRY